MLTCVMTADASAAEALVFTRADYDLIMRWINFGILMALVIKYARAPVKNFLKDKQAEVARSIRQVEEEKRHFEMQIQESRTRLASGRERMKLVREKIIAEGHRCREELIAQAQHQSRYMLQSARLKIDARIRDNIRQFRMELIDMAYETASARLPGLLNGEDHERFISDWLKAVDK